MTRPVHVHWFRHGLRLHDNAALEAALEPRGGQSPRLIAVFTLDGLTSGQF